MAFNDPNRPPDVYNVIKLDQIVQHPEDLQTLIESIAEARFQRNGKYRGIVEFMKALATSIEQDWESVTRQYYMNNLTPSQFYATFIRKDSNGSDQYKVPSVYPFKANINQVLESKDLSPDSPMNEIEEFILFDIAENRPASLSKRPYGTRKEVAPRFRFWLQNGNIQYPVMAKRKEYTITFRVYAHSTEESQLMREALEMYFDIKKEVLYSLGAQKFYVIGDGRRTEDDKPTTMPYKEMDLYFRAEQWYIGEGAPLIEKIYMDWNVLGDDTTGEHIIERPISPETISVDISE